MEYNSLNTYLKKTFGTKVYKLALDGGFTCPNRDGTCGRGGCIFCSGGSGDFSVPVGDDVYSAIERAKEIVGTKNKTGKYIAYFQSFTGTYAPVDRLRKLYMQAVNHPDIVVLDIGTRPDCLGAEVMDLLKELNGIKPVWIELGLQTIHPETAEYIRRGYPLSVYDEAIRKLKDAGIYTVVHMILGLPGETPEMMAESAEYIGRSGADGIKLQLLHVLKDTDLYADYMAGKFKTMELCEYISALEKCVAVLPEGITIHRLTGDGAKKNLASPLWSGDKKRVLNEINKVLRPKEE